MNVPSGSREARILRTSYIGIAANVLLVIVKAAVGTLAGSLALVTDAVNNLSDVISSIITIAGTKMAGKLPDTEHPFGHGRLEYITALIIGAIVLAAGIGAAAESVEGILHPTPVEYSAGFVIIIVISAQIVLENFSFSFGKNKAIFVHQKRGRLPSFLVHTILFFLAHHLQFLNDEVLRPEGRVTLS